MISPPRIALNPDIGHAIETLQIDAILDSGGFQEESDIQRYADILLQTHQYFAWFPNLDAIGDQSLSNKRFDQLQQILPKEVRRKLVWVYQNGEASMLREYCQEFKFIGVGGLVPLAGNISDLRSRLKTVGSTLEATSAKAHFFGVTGISILRWLSLHDWFASTDSTRWLAAISRGELLTTAGKSIEAANNGYLFTPEERARHSIRVLQAIVSAHPERLQLDLLETA